MSEKYGGDEEFSEEHREAVRLCEDISKAVELYRVSQELSKIAQRAYAQVSTELFLGNKGFKFLIEPRGKAYVTRDDEVIDDLPADFIAEELWGISEHGVVFYNRTQQTRLHIEGYEFEVYPVRRSQA